MKKFLSILLIFFSFSSFYSFAGDLKIQSSNLMDLCLSKENYKGFRSNYSQESDTCELIYDEGLIIEDLDFSLGVTDQLKFSIFEELGQLKTGIFDKSKVICY